MKLFSADIPALTARDLTGLNYRTVHRLYSRWKERIIALALEEIKPFSGERWTKVISERAGCEANEVVEMGLEK